MILSHLLHNILHTQAIFQKGAQRQAHTNQEQASGCPWRKCTLFSIGSGERGGRSTREILPAVHPSDSASASVASVRPHGAFPSSLHGTEHVARGKNTTLIPESGHPPFMPSAKLHSASRHGDGALVFLQSSKGNENQSRLEMAVVVLHDSSQNGAVRTRHTHGHSFLCLSLTSQLRGGLEVPRHSGKWEVFWGQIGDGKGKARGG